ncbi:hypothetical protein PVAP13_4NG285700 [Panicum virgatum]|uniref:Uncharacterized protein n=1 Tax=Panicum virgatum TaxID=38727 RepID=A0A8T0TG22_PANVG|nr:hypothetical protein PVAP13_4NG285700 [Panicum virgatum]
MALRLLGSKLPRALPRHLVRGLPPVAKTVPLAQAGSDSIFGRRDFSSGLPTENTQMSSSKKDPSAPGNVKPPGADEESDSSGRDVIMRFADRCFFWISTACVVFTIYTR